MMRQVKAPGNRIFIKLKPIEKVHDKLSEGGIVLEVRTDKKLKLEQESIYIGHVIALGPEAYAEYKEPWCKVGDCVQISKYSGTLVDDVEEGEVYRMVNDIDVQAVFPSEGV